MNIKNIHQNFISLPYRINCIECSPDGQQIACTGNQLIMIFDSISFEQIGSDLIGHTKLINAIKYSQNSQWIASGSGLKDGNDCTLRIWHSKHQYQISQTLNTLQSVHAVAFSPDQTHVASGSYPRIVIWDWQKGEQKCVLQGHKDIVYALNYSQDGSKLVSGGRDRSIIIWDVMNGQIFKELKGINSWVILVQYISTSQIIFCCLNGSIRVWNCRNSRTFNKKSYKEQQIYSTAISPDNSLIIQTYYPQKLCLWERRSGKIVHILNSFVKNANEIAFSSDGRSIVQGDCVGNLVIGALLPNHQCSS